MSQRRQDEITKVLVHMVECERVGVYAKHPACHKADNDRLFAISNGEPYYDYDAQEWVDSE